MKQLIRLMGVLLICGVAVSAAFAGTEMYSGKESKAVAPAPMPECNWTGFYLGVNVGGQWGHSEDNDLDLYWPHGMGPEHDQKWGYDENGVVAGGQVGYNFQWNWLVLGVEAEGGYMDLNGSGNEPWSSPPGGPNVGSSDSDFFTTIRGRVGFAFGHWLFYGTGGGIGLNYETRVDDDPEDVHFHKQDFDWGWTGGGGIEYMFGCHWSVKAEYLRYVIDEQRFSGVWATTAPGGNGLRYRFDGNTEGNILRAGLNYKF